ncbi:MAG: nitroreductase family protein [Planctomycetaceae bacterium]
MRRARLVAARWIARQLARHNRLIALYYAWTGTYDFEQHASFHGKFRHILEVQNHHGDGLRYSLRRSVHRIEKGLIMQPRRPVFAADYIQCTVEQYGRLIDEHSQLDSARDPLIDWAGDVLSAYFLEVEASPAIDQARAMFQKIGRQPRLLQQCRAPYRRDLTPLQIDYAALRELAERRRSVRWYLQRPVPRELIDRAVEVARWSPSACNRQPFEFRIFDEPELVRQIADIPMGTSGFSHNIPCIVVVIGHWNAFQEDRDRHVPYIDSSLAVMAFQYALEVQGVSSCSLNWPEIRSCELKMRRLLELQPDERPVLLISLGFPDADGLVPCSEKKTVEQIRSYNRVGPSRGRHGS